MSIEYAYKCDFCGHGGSSGNVDLLPTHWRRFWVYMSDHYEPPSRVRMLMESSSLDLCEKCYGRGMTAVRQRETVGRAWWSKKVFGHFKFWKGDGDVSEVERKT